jgi:hypothetical protein
MADKPSHEFGKRRPVGPPLIAPAPVKRSGHVALLLMGTLAVGGGAYALMPSENCQQKPPGMAAAAECQPRGSSSGGHGGSGGSSSRSSFFSGTSSSSDSSASHSGSGASESGGVQRGGFGSFAHAFAGHFSGGG